MSDRLHPIVTKLIDDWFLNSSEEDYLVARWASQNGLVYQYCWSAAQCIEKMIKAALLKERISINHKGPPHNLIPLFSQLSDSPTHKIPKVIDLGLTSDFIDKHEFYSMFLEPINTAKLVETISNHGDPNGRYRATPSVSHVRLEVHRLDAIFLILRGAAGRQLEAYEAPEGQIIEAQEIATFHFRELFFLQQSSRADLSKVLTKQNLAFFPELFENSLLLDRRGSMRSNSYPLQKSNAELFGDSALIQDLGWLIENSLISPKLKAKLSEISHEIRPSPPAKKRD